MSKKPMTKINFIDVKTSNNFIGAFRVFVILSYLFILSQQNMIVGIFWLKKLNFDWKK